MYFVKYGKEYLHDPRHEEYVLLDLSIDSEANSCGYCDFTIYPDHPMYNKIRERDGDNPVEVYDDDILLFAGYIYELGKEFYQDGHVKCKGELSYLSESIVRPYSTVPRGFGTLAPHTLSAYFEWLIEQHNNQVSENKRFKMGINQGSALTTESYLYLENDSYPNTLDEINDKILGDDGYGGYIRIRHEGSDRYIDYISNWTESNTQILDFGKNLTDYTQTDDSDEIASFVVPLGAPMSQTTYDYDDGYRVTQDTKPSSNKTYYTYDSEDKRYIQCGNMTAFESGVTYYEYYENYDESNNALTVDGLATRTYDNDYRNLNDMIYSDKAVKKYGWVGFTYKNENITDKDVLAYYGAVALKQRVSPKRTIEIKAIDMHLINPDVKLIRIGEYVRVRSKPHNLDSYFLCSSITLDLNAPQNSLYTLGSSFNTLTGEQNKKIKELNATISTAYDAAAKLTEKEKQTAINVSQALTSADAAKKAAASAVTDTTDEYAVSESSAEAPTSGWSSETPSWTAGLYIWKRTSVTHGDGASSVGSPVLVTGNPGVKGEDGKDGLNGEAATVVKIESSRGTVFKNDQVSTVLSAVIYYGPQRIVDSATMKAVYGESSYLQWKEQGSDEATFTLISSTDPRLSNDGFTLTISSADVDSKATFMCELIIE